jgi:hypothetical protein
MIRLKHESRTLFVNTTGAEAYRQEWHNVLHRRRYTNMTNEGYFPLGYESVTTKLR